MNLDKDRERLSQAANLAWLRRDWKAAEMITVDLSYEHPLQQHFIHQCALIPQDLVSLELSKATLDETRLYDGGVPAAFSPTWGDEGQVEYFRYGVENGVEPLIINRSFHRIREGYPEISEEFRHFHRLYHDRKTDEYIKIDDAGNEEVVAVVRPNQIKIRLKEIRQFLAVKQMFLSIRFDFSECSEHSLKDLGIDSDSRSDLQSDSDRLMCWTHYYGDYSSASRKSFSMLMGKRLIKPLAKSKSGFGDFAEQDREYVEFIFDVDENGDGIRHTCDPDKLNDLSGENPDAPFSLTPIHFSKKVLDKYYNEPGKYTVRDSGVSCGSLWSMEIDNHASDKVCVMFRDLCLLPYTEQLHWRMHNVLPEGGVSETFFRRKFQGEWASSDQPDRLFKQHYELLQTVLLELLFEQHYKLLQRACDECLGWQLLKPLGSGDKHRLRRIKVPDANDEPHFKDLVLDLIIVLIDKSLNAKRLKALIPVAERKKGKRVISLLESAFKCRGVAGSEKHIRFLRSLWDLRSTRSSAHPENLGDPRYARAAKHFGFGNPNPSADGAKILEEAVAFLAFLTDVVRSGKLNVLPEGGVSETFYGRNIEGLWMDSDQPDLLFKQHYELLQRACDECLGWQLLKPLGSGDKHRLQRIRVSAVDEESHFKDLVLDLTSVLIDTSLNAKRLKDLIPVAERKKGERGISLLESVFGCRGVAGSEKHILFLRSLWDLRTTRSSAHPENLGAARYERAAKHFDLGNLNRRAAFAKILEEAVAFLAFLTDVVRSGKLGDKNGDGC